MIDVALITRPEEAVEMLAKLISDNAGILNKEVHASHTFNVTLRCIIWVYHAEITKTHQQRSLEDLELATGLVALIEDDKTFQSAVIFSFIDSESPGIVAPRRGRGEPIVGTRITWEALTQQRWD